MNLFEYQNKEQFSGSLENLEGFLDDIWEQREKKHLYSDSELEVIETQQFLQVFHKTKELKSNKYTGVIHFEGHKINLLPKIFYEADRQYKEEDICCMQAHILWWLSYCRKIKFPSYRTSMGSMKSDFFEVLVYLFAKYTNRLLFSSIYQQYEEEEKEVAFIKGRLNINEYIHENLARGRWHKLNCAYDIFAFDNKFNRIIKYVASMLLNVTRNFENKNMLREIIFILDEVSDCKPTVRDCQNIRFNPLFSEFETVRDYCMLFLNNSISYEYKNALKLFAFLLPMEYVFEDFIFGFIDREVKEVNASSQVSSKHLDKEEIFVLRPDMLLNTGSRQIIADTKYKVIYSEVEDPKKGISQGDLYQMLSYAVRFKIKDVILFYPDTVQGYRNSPSQINIKDEFAENIDVNIRAYQLPIINHQLFRDAYAGSNNLSDMFESTKAELKERIRSILTEQS